LLKTQLSTAFQVKKTCRQT